MHDFIPDFAVREYRVDPNRVHLTGLEPWRLGDLRVPRKDGAGIIAAQIAISGDGRPALADAGVVASRRCRIPAFHGEMGMMLFRSPAAGYRSSSSEGARTQPELEFTVYPEAKHDAWL